MSLVDEIEVTNVYSRHVEAIAKHKAKYAGLKASEYETPVIGHEGGSRSSKTWQILIYLLVYMFLNAGKGKKITVARLKLTWLKATVLQDFFTLVRKYNLPMTPEPNPRRSEQVYTIYGNTIEFVGMDDSGKFQGRLQNISWINEALQTSNKDDIEQMWMRTDEEFIIDYNPTLTEHFVYDIVDLNKAAYLIKSTVLDNPFIAPALRNKILSYRPTPENRLNGTADKYYWDVFGLGIRGRKEGLIFTKCKWVNKFPETCKWTVYGIDYGFTNDPSTIVRVSFQHGQLWVQEQCYETGLTATPAFRDGKLDERDENNLHSKLLSLGIKQGKDEIVPDLANPMNNEELRRAGWNIKKLPGGKDTIANGIDILQRYVINIVSTEEHPCVNFKKEADNYKYQVNQAGKVINKPVDLFNHLWDPTRYVAQYKLKKHEVKIGMTQ